MTGGTRNMHWLKWTGSLLLACAAAAFSQPAPSPTLPEAALAEARQEARALEVRLPEPKVAPKPAFDLSPEKEARCRKFLPRSLFKLRQREPLQILAMGDSSLEVQREEGQPPVRAFPAVFAQELADRFFYTGGVYDLTDRGASRSSFTPAIALRTISRPGGGILDAVGALNAASKQMAPDLVLLCYGQQEALSGLPPPVFARAVEDAIEAARKLGADVIVCTPWLPMAASAEVAWGSVRPLTDAAREVAAQESVLHVDLGDLSRLLEVAVPGSPDAPHVFSAVESTYRGLFLETARGRFIPREILHSRLGSMVFENLMDGRPEMPWVLSQASASVVKPDHLVVKMTLENRGDTPLALTALPLIANGWRPVEVTPRLTVPGPGKQELKVEYTRHGSGTFALEEPVLRLPVLICAGSQARVEDARATVQPLALVWSPATLFNLEEAFLAGCHLVNNSSREIDGTWKAELGGKKLEGQFSAKPGASFPLDLRFDLPQEAAPAQVLPLVVTITADGSELTSRRQVEFVRNLGLAQQAPLRPLAGGTEGPDAVTFQATADARQLTLTCTVADPTLLQDAPDAGPAWQMDVNLDARSYGKRLEGGATGTLHVTGSTADGPGQVHEIPSWAFGTDYAALFDPQELKAALTTEANGRKRITLTIPKTYLYLHEWALDNGNSQLGLNVRLTFRQTEVGGKERFLSYGLSVNTKTPEDVDSLAVLELTTKPTKRVTVNLY